MNQPQPALARLDELSDYTVAEGDPDPRGWRVTTPDGRNVGRVADLVVDMDAMKARYLDVAVSQQLTGAAGHDRHVLVPAASVRIGGDERTEQRICISATPEFIARAAATPAPSDAEHADYERQWPVEGDHACHVRITREGTHG